MHNDISSWKHQFNRRLTQIDADTEETKTGTGFSRRVRSLWLEKAFADSLVSACIGVHLRFSGSSRRKFLSFASVSAGARAPRVQFSEPSRKTPAGYGDGGTGMAVLAPQRLLTLQRFNASTIFPVTL